MAAKTALALVGVTFADRWDAVVLVRLPVLLLPLSGIRLLLRVALTATNVCWLLPVRSFLVNGPSLCTEPPLSLGVGDR
jgi:hypothetical protein